MKEIPLTRGLVALVDDEDYAEVSKRRWYAVEHGGVYYAARKIGHRETERIVYMARQIMHPAPGNVVDHINRNPLDNRRENLRECTTTENQWNKGVVVQNTSGFVGVSKDKWGWKAHTYHHGEYVWIGRFPTKEEAAFAYDRVVKGLRGEFAYLNFPRQALEA